MILAVRACTALSSITPRTRQTHRTPEPCFGTTGDLDAPYNCGHFVSLRRRDVETFKAATCRSSRAQLPAGARALRARAARGTKRHTEQRGARSERPKREDGFPADRPHPVQRRQGGPDGAASPGADGRVAAAPTTRWRTSRTSAAPTTTQHRRRLTGATSRHPTTGKREPAYAHSLISGSLGAMITTAAPTCHAPRM
jgi:hypothetical protein